MLPKPTRPAVTAVLLLALGATAATADWLVLGDGTKLETRGPWEVQGKLVVFTTADGALASLRLTEVDLEASRAATEAAGRPEPATPEPESRQAAYVITDADVTHAPTEGAGEVAEDAAPDATTDTGGLVVTQWQEGEIPDGSGLRITGTLQNRSDNAATRVRLTALLYDAEGSLLATGEADLSTRVLMPDRQVRFRVDFPAVFAMSGVRFEATSLDFEAGSPEGVEEEEGGASG